MTGFNAIAVFCLDGCVLLAGQAQYARMGRRTRTSGSGIDWSELWIPIAVLGCAAGIAWLVSRFRARREKRNADSPQALFAELCRAHRLDWPNQQLLRALANAHQLPSPAVLFVEPERFDVERLGTVFANREAQVAALRSRLFAASAGEGPKVS